LLTCVDLVYIVWVQSKSKRHISQHKTQNHSKMKNDIRKQNAVVPAIAGGLCYEPGCHGIFVLKGGGTIGRKKTGCPGEVMVDQRGQP
jgi:hypothetical protein